MATGGRAGFKKDGMTRRTFLKILGGAMSIPIIGKFLKPMKVGKTVTKVPMIKTDDVAGKPEWFDALVNKVIEKVMMLQKDLQQVRDNLFIRKHLMMVPWSELQKTWMMVL